MNLQDVAVTVDLTLLDSNGVEQATAQIQLTVMGHLATFLNQEENIQWSQPVDFTEFAGTLRAAANGRLAATVIQTRPGQFATLPVVVQ